MKIENKNENFMSWCKFMYDENCLERHHHGQHPYKNFETYYSRNESWLRSKYVEVDGVREVSLYLS